MDLYLHTGLAEVDIAVVAQLKRITSSTIPLSRSAGFHQAAWWRGSRMVVRAQQPNKVARIVRLSPLIPGP
jgi:hypothetical protein